MSGLSALVSRLLSPHRRGGIGDRERRRLRIENNFRRPILCMWRRPVNSQHCVLGCTGCPMFVRESMRQKRRVQPLSTLLLCRQKVRLLRSGRRSQKFIDIAFIDQGYSGIDKGRYGRHRIQ